MGKLQMHKAVIPKPLTYVFLWALVCAVGACGSTVATSTGPSPTKCDLTLAVPPSAVSSGGDTATVGVTTQPECTWSASSEAGWITGLTPSSGQGSAQLQMQIAANPDGTARQGDIVVNGQRGRIRQDAAACRFELSTAEQTVPAGGGTGRITLTAPVGCAWSAQADAAWVVLTSGTTGTGSGSVAYTIGSNGGTTARSASIVVAGQRVNITQEASGPCSVTVSPKDVTFSAPGTKSGSISVTAASSCDWSARSGSSWILLTGRTSGTGNGTVAFSVESNTGAARNGELTIGDKTVPVNQLAATGACSSTVTPLTISIAAGGASGTSVSVTSSGACAWTAASNVSWISIASGGSGSGNGTVTIAVAANNGAARSGTLAIAGQTVTVNQAGSQCSYSVMPTNVSVTAAGGAGTAISVTTASGCSWTVATNAEWITILTAATSSGNGTVAYSVQPNTGSARTATLTVAGRSVSIAQNAACSYSISPHDHTMEKGGGTGTVSVNTQSGCAWTAVNNVNWIAITSGATGSDDGTVKYTVQANTTGNNRTGTLTIAGQTFTLTEKK